MLRRIGTVASTAIGNYAPIVTSLEVLILCLGVGVVVTRNEGHGIRGFRIRFELKIPLGSAYCMTKATRSAQVEGTSLSNG